MELVTNKSYCINVRDDNELKCSKDCKYMMHHSSYGYFCILETCTSNRIHDSEIEDYNRTEYCKKFFENKRGN